jgi:sugar phosphate isomerase/epimerase
MNTRRKFLQEAATLTIGGTLLTNSSWANIFAGPNLPAPGIQLFTLFNEMDMDTVGALQKVAAAGYKNIESAFSKQPGFYGKKPKEFKSLLKDMGMEWRSHHVVGAPFKLPPGYKLPLGPDGQPVKFPVMKNLKDNSQEMVDMVAEAGIEYIVCANIPIDTADEIKEAAVILQKTGEQAKKAGVQLVYHNHATEFNTTGGIVSYDYFLTQISADILKMELDLGWVFKAKKNPVDIFKKNKGRFPLLHIKDMDAAGNIVPFGTGSYDFKETFKNVDLAGMNYYFLEQDFPKHPFEDIKTSIDNFGIFKKSL